MATGVRDLVGSLTTETTLANGFRYSIVPLEDATGHDVDITVSLTVRHGSRDDYGTGVAHVWEHMAFHGGGDMVGRNGIWYVAERNGVHMNAMTWMDGTMFYFNGKSAHMIDMIHWLHMNITEPRFENKDLLTERTVVISEKEIGASKIPMQIHEELMSLVFSKTEEGRPVIGNRGELIKTRHADVLRYLQTYYQPGEMKMFIVGDVKECDHGIIADTIQSTFGTQKPSEIVMPRNMKRQDVQTGPRRSVIRTAGNEAMIAVGYPLPGAASEDCAALTMLDKLLISAEHGAPLHSAIQDVCPGASLSMYVESMQHASVLMIAVAVPVKTLLLCNQKPVIRDTSQATIDVGVGFDDKSIIVQTARERMTDNERSSVDEWSGVRVAVFEPLLRTIENVIDAQLAQFSANPYTYLIHGHGDMGKLRTASRTPRGSSAENAATVVISDRGQTAPILGLSPTATDEEVVDSYVATLYRMAETELCAILTDSQKLTDAITVAWVNGDVLSWLDQYIPPGLPRGQVTTDSGASVVHQIRSVLQYYCRPAAKTVVIGAPGLDSATLTRILPVAVAERKSDGLSRRVAAIQQKIHRQAAAAATTGSISAPFFRYNGPDATVWRISASTPVQQTPGVLASRFVTFAGREMPSAQGIRITVSVPCFLPELAGAANNDAVVGRALFRSVMCTIIAQSSSAATQQQKKQMGVSVGYSDSTERGGGLCITIDVQPNQVSAQLPVVDLLAFVKSAIAEEMSAGLAKIPGILSNWAQCVDANVLRAQDRMESDAQWRLMVMAARALGLQHASLDLAIASMVDSDGPAVAATLRATVSDLASSIEACDIAGTVVSFVCPPGYYAPLKNTLCTPLVTEVISPMLHQAKDTHKVSDSDPTRRSADYAADRLVIMTQAAKTPPLNLRSRGSPVLHHALHINPVYTATAHVVLAKTIKMSPDPFSEDSLATQIVTELVRVFSGRINTWTRNISGMGYVVTTNLLTDRSPDTLEQEAVVFTSATCHPLHVPETAQRLLESWAHLTYYGAEAPSEVFTVRDAVASLTGDLECDIVLRLFKRVMDKNGVRPSPEDELEILTGRRATGEAAVAVAHFPPESRTRDNSPFAALFDACRSNEGLQSYFLGFIANVFSEIGKAKCRLIGSIMDVQYGTSDPAACAADLHRLATWLPASVHEWTPADGKNGRGWETAMKIYTMADATIRKHCATMFDVHAYVDTTNASVLVASTSLPSQVIDIALESHVTDESFKAVWETSASFTPTAADLHKMTDAFKQHDRYEFSKPPASQCGYVLDS